MLKLAFLALVLVSETYSRLLERQVVLPDRYGAPPNDDAFGTETPLTTTTDKEVESVDETRSRKFNEKLIQKETLGGPSNEGVYYIYHPTGLLQKVTFSTKDDPKKMSFAARLKYQNVEPISGPVYTYDPNTFVFKHLQ